MLLLARKARCFLSLGCPNGTPLLRSCCTQVPHNSQHVAGVFTELAIDAARPDAPLLVNDDVTHIRHLHIRALHVIQPDDAHLWIAEQRKLQAELCHSMPCHAGRIDADPQYHGLFLTEAGEMALQLPELPQTVGSNISHIEHQHDRLLANIRRELHRRTGGTRQREEGRCYALFGGNHGPRRHAIRLTPGSPQEYPNGCDDDG